MNPGPLPEEIKRVRDEVVAYARAYGLDFFDTIFEMVDLEGMLEVASYGGFPNRYPHWRFGMDFEELDRTTTYGLSRIYELVLNTDPCYAYLLRSNSLTEQKLVIAHVLGHSDFFKNNQWFSATNRKMLDEMANHAVRVRRIMDRVGVEAVEDFIDACLSLENLLDIHAPHIRRDPAPEDEDAEGDDEEEGVHRLRSKDYMDPYINPEAFLEAQRQEAARLRERRGRVPPHPVKDIPGFLLDYAPLEPWEWEILSMVREEAYYFVPQRQTKIMNEGWACVAADTPVFTEGGILPMAEVVGGGARLVWDGEAERDVYDRHVIRDHSTITMTTRRGLTLTGSSNHRVLLADRTTWKRLDELAPGDRVAISGGGGRWGAEAEGGSSAGSERAAWRPLTGTQRGAAGSLSREPEAGTMTVSAPVRVPARVMRSSGGEVRSWLRDLFDGAAEVEADGIRLHGTDDLTRDVQLLLLNAGVLSARGPAASGDDAWDLVIEPGFGSAFADEIGSESHARMRALRRFIQWNEPPGCATGDDEVVSLAPGRADVYDISVSGTHRYAAAGLVNHNSYWHARIMTERALGDAELIDYAERHSGTMAMQPGSLNPYKLGLELFRDIEDRWNRGAHGAEYDECPDIHARAGWDLKKGEGMAKIFEVRRVHNDVTFIDAFLTEEFCRKHRFFTYAYDEDEKTVRIKSREFQEIKERLLFSLTNFGQPFIYVEDANFRNRGELLMTHRHEGFDLKLDWTRDTLERVVAMWRRPVHLLTQVRGHVKLLGHDGEKWTEEDLGTEEPNETTA